MAPSFAKAATSVPQNGTLVAESARQSEADGPAVRPYLLAYGESENTFVSVDVVDVRADPTETHFRNYRE